MITEFQDIISQENYAIIEKSGDATVYAGELHEFETLDELESFQKSVKKKLVFLLPFCQGEKEGMYEAHGDEKIQAIEVEKQVSMTKNELLSILPDREVNIGDLETSISDEEFEELVRRFKQEIENGNVCQTILSREFLAQIEDGNNPEVVLSMYKMLLAIEGGYMTFFMKLGGKEKVYTGASPEVHLYVDDKIVEKNPIAGTERKSSENFGKILLNFLRDKKERQELCMVSDEELKMLFANGMVKSGTISGPNIREIGAVVHTENNLVGDRNHDFSLIDNLRQTIFSPTLVGGPLEKAFKLIKEYESGSRRYYGSAFGTLDDTVLDTCITIRTGEIDTNTGELSVRAGAGIVDGSEPKKEMIETKIKAAGFLGIFNKESPIFSSFMDTLSQEEIDEIDVLIAERRSLMSDFYLNRQEEDLTVPEIAGKEIVLINNEDNFVHMIGYMLARMGAKIKIVDNIDFNIDKINNQIVLLGPGPGDINNPEDQKMIKLLEISKQLQENNTPTLGVCLGHQAICKGQGHEVKKQDRITQGVQEKVEIFGETEILAFYNSFSPMGNKDDFQDAVISDEGRVLYQKGHNSVSSQFHPESIMSVNGFNVLKNMVLELLK